MLIIRRVWRAVNKGGAGVPPAELPHKRSKGKMIVLGCTVLAALLLFAGFYFGKKAYSDSHPEMVKLGITRELTADEMNRAGTAIQNHLWSDNFYKRFRERVGSAPRFIDGYGQNAVSRDGITSERVFYTKVYVPNLRPTADAMIDFVRNDLKQHPDILPVDLRPVFTESRSAAVAPNLSFDAFVERVRRELSRASVRFGTSCTSRR